jgi:NinB protein
MSQSIRTTLINPQQANAALNEAYRTLKPYLMAEHRFDLAIRPETRSTAQNSRLWAMLADVSRQVVWHGQKLVSEDWKHVFTAALKRTRVCPGIDGGFVVLGQSTSQMTRAEMSELQELIEAFGAQHGVEFSAPEYEREPA